ncbi:hypothetical protein OAK19_00445 [Aureispira]|nr:hypothetical protein [Aureispira sp.]
MKYLFIILVPLICYTNTNAQIYMHVRLSNDTIKTFEIADVNNVYFNDFGGCPDSIIDSRDNQIYGVIRLYNQCWMAENLNYDVPGSALIDMPAPINGHGRLYDWETLMNGASSSALNPSGVKGICPDGWHVPSHSEWNEMEIELGMPEADTSNTGWRGTHGLKLKSTSGWNSGGNGNDSTGMNVLPAGGYFSFLYGQGGNAAFWTSTEFSTTSSWGRALKHQYSGVGSYYYYLKTYGFSCRCVMD